ncbi:MAG: hypothetical protein ACWA44_04450 [Thiotrichales bacterium]
MNAANFPMIQIAVYETTLPMLFAMKQSREEPLADVIQRISKDTKRRKPLGGLQDGDCKEEVLESGYRHQLLVLDSVIGADSFGELYGKLIDVVSDVADDVIEDLASMRARSRFYVSRNRAGIHPGSPHLPTLKTTSGWYVSRNVGFKDFVRGVQALCVAGEIEYGKDIRLLHCFLDGC